MTESLVNPKEMRGQLKLEEIAIYYSDQSKQCIILQSLLGDLQVAGLHTTSKTSQTTLMKNELSALASFNIKD